MGKYETKFKLKVVESFLAGEGGALSTGHQSTTPLKREL